MATHSATAWSSCGKQITQQRGANDLGSISFTNAGDYSAFANFPGRFQRARPPSIQPVFRREGAPPNQFRQTYFFQTTGR